MDSRLAIVLWFSQGCRGTPSRAMASASFCSQLATEHLPQRVPNGLFQRIRAPHTEQSCDRARARMVSSAARSASRCSWQYFELQYLLCVQPGCAH